MLALHCCIHLPRRPAEPYPQATVRQERESGELTFARQASASFCNSSTFTSRYSCGAFFEDWVIARPLVVSSIIGDMIFTLTLLGRKLVWGSPVSIEPILGVNLISNQCLRSPTGEVLFGKKMPWQIDPFRREYFILHVAKQNKVQDRESTRKWPIQRQRTAYVC